MRLARGVRECDHQSGAIVLAASQIMRQDGYNDAAKVITALQFNPDLGTKLKKAIDIDIDGPKPKANHIRTLGLIFRNGVTVDGYEQWRKEINKTVGHSVYPAYKILAQSKAFLRPIVSLESLYSLLNSLLI